MSNLTFEKLPAAMENLMAQVAELTNLVKHRQAEPVDRKKPMNIDDAAVYLNMSKSSLYKKVSLEEVPSHKNGQLYFFRDELDEWAKGGYVAPSKTRQSAAVRSVANRM